MRGLFEESLAKICITVTGERWMREVIVVGREKGNAFSGIETYLWEQQSGSHCHLL